jgi:hypothetical protein
MSGREYLTLSASKEVVERKIEIKLEEEQQKFYRRGIGSLLYLVKHSRPDLLNCTRELSKFDGSSRS